MTTVWSCNMLSAPKLSGYLLSLLLASVLFLTGSESLSQSLVLLLLRAERRQGHLKITVQWGGGETHTPLSQKYCLCIRTFSVTIGLAIGAFTRYYEIFKYRKWQHFGVFSFKAWYWYNINICCPTASLQLFVQHIWLRMCVYIIRWYKNKPVPMTWDSFLNLKTAAKNLNPYKLFQMFWLKHKQRLREFVSKGSL